MSYEKLFNDFLASGLIKRLDVNFIQIEKLIQRAQKDLIVAEKNLTIDEEVAYNYAYLAMLRSGRALLFLKGFRPSDGQQHKTVIDIAQAILGKEFELLVEKFDKMRRKRNQFTYDPFFPVSRTESIKALKTAGYFVKVVSNLIKKETPNQRFDF
ncbi:HEPN domain-containing protein [bacterium]|nr:HEPN domain-containing protein [bacterium]